MASRDRYAWEVSCDKCGNKGVLHISEDDYPFMKNPHRAVDRVDGDFVADFDRDSVAHIKCKCGHAVR